MEGLEGAEVAEAAVAGRATRPTTDLMGVVGAARFGTGAEAMAKEREATVGASSKGGASSQAAVAAGALVAPGTRGLVAVAAAALRATDPFRTGTVKQPAEASRSTTPRRDVSCCQYVRLLSREWGYRRAGGSESLADRRGPCRVCHCRLNSRAVANIRPAEQQ